MLALLNECESFQRSQPSASLPRRRSVTRTPSGWTDREVRKHSSESMADSNRTMSSPSAVVSGANAQRSETVALATAEASGVTRRIRVPNTPAIGSKSMKRNETVLESGAHVALPTDANQSSGWHLFGPDQVGSHSRRSTVDRPPPPTSAMKLP